MSRWRRDDATAEPVWFATAADADQMRALGVDLAAVLRAGDLVLLDGPLGAGKTTLTQGIGRALSVRGTVTSPTFVIARSHRGPGPTLVHVDAYRLGSAVEVDDLDLDADLESAVTVVEWGAGKVEGLAEERLEVRIRRAAGRVEGDEGAAGAEGAEAPTRITWDPDDPSGGTRTIRVRGIGPRWVGLVLAPATSSPAG